jgi:hypothetical protein
LHFQDKVFGIARLGFSADTGPQAIQVDRLYVSAGGETRRAIVQKDRISIPMPYPWGRSQESDGLHVDDLGVDHLFVDKSQFFKNIDLRTGHSVPAEDRLLSLWHPNRAERSSSPLPSPPKAPESLLGGQFLQD